MKLYTSLKQYLENLNIDFEEAQLSEYSTVKIGGSALVVLPESESELISVLDYLSEKRIKHRVLGAMSNTLALSEGYDGVAVITRRLDKWIIDGELLIASAGVRISSAVNALAERSLTGFEELVGIPGLVGGLIYENAGAFSRSVSDILCSARLYDKRTRKALTFTNEEMHFGYRHSILTESPELVLLSAAFKLQPCTDNATIREKIRSYAEKRRSAQPLEYPSLGSVFKRPAVGFAGAYIEEAGLKGLSIGGACVSHKHAGFIINTGNAGSDDFISLMDKIEDTVFKIYGVKLEREVEILQ